MSWMTSLVKNKEGDIVGYPVCGRVISKEISAILGLKNVVSLDISLHMDSAAQITVTYFPDEETLRKIVPVLQKYQLVAI